MYTRVKNTTFSFYGLLLFFFLFVLPVGAEGDIPVFTLEQLVASALQKNKEYLAARKSVDVATGELRQARIVRNPALTVQYDMQALNGSSGQTFVYSPVTGSLVPEANRPNTPASWTIGLSQPLALFGLRSSRILYAEKNKESASLLFLDYQRLFKSQIRQIYWSLLYQIKILEFNKSFYRNYQELVRSNEIRLKAGSISDLEYKRILIDEARYRKMYEDQAIAVKALKNQLKLAAGLEGSMSDFNLAGDFEVPARELVFSAFDLERINQRSDILASAAGVKGAQAELDVRKLEPFADVSAGVFFHRELARGGFQPDSYAGFAISLPLPALDRNQGMVDAAEARLEQKRLSFEQQRLSALTDLENQRQQMEAAYAIYQDYSKTLEVNREVYEKMRFMYLRGATSLINLLESERSYYDFQRNYLDLVYSLLSAAEVYRTSLEIVEPSADERSKTP